MDYKIIIIFLYGGVGLLNIFAFFPTIKDLYLNKKKRANFHSYLIWLLASLITFLYAFLVVKDFLFSIVSGISVFLNIIVLIGYFRIIYIKKCDYKMKKCKKKFLKNI